MLSSLPELPVKEALPRLLSATAGHVRVVLEAPSLLYFGRAFFSPLT
jgi:hypothetical protein